MWVRAPKGATPANETSAIDWQMASELVKSPVSHLVIIINTG